MINTMIWNIRGIAGKVGLCRLKRFVKLYRLKIVDILEPMVTHASIAYYAYMLGLINYHFNVSEKIWVFWDESIRASIFRDHAQCLSMSFKLLNLSCEIGCSFIYAKTTRTERYPLWDELRSVFSLANSPWLVGGDFNIVKSASEKLRGARASFNAMEDFANCLLDCGLLDIPFLGSQFTWTNGIIFQRLHRILVNPMWCEFFDKSLVTHLAKDGSDHCPLLFNGSKTEISSPSSFRFLNMWTSHHNFMHIVKTSWNLPLDAIGITRYWFKQQRLKNELKRWNKHDFGDIFSQQKQLEKKVEEFEIIHQNDPSIVNKMNLNQGNAQLNKYLAYQEKFWQQKSGCKWLVEGERNTRYFQMLLKKKRFKNRIFEIKVDDTNVVSNLTEIKSSAVSFFSSLFARDPSIVSDFDCSLIPSLVTDRDNSDLNKIPSVEEIKQTVFECDIYSTAGPDGFSALFFQHCWEIVCDDLCEAVIDFFRGEHLLKGITSTTIALIPKVDNPNSWTGFRPISLCNFFNKILSKIMATRLSRILSKLILENQSGFILGRFIDDNILLAQEMVHCINEKIRGGNVVLKLDMMKVYDRLDWGFFI